MVNVQTSGLFFCHQISNELEGNSCRVSRLTWTFLPEKVLTSIFSLCSLLVAEHLIAQHSAIKMLHSRVKIILEYVKAVEAGERTTGMFNEAVRAKNVKTEVWKTAVLKWHVLFLHFYPTEGGPLENASFITSPCLILSQQHHLTSLF